MELSEEVGNHQELTEEEEKWPLPHERKLLDVWTEPKDISGKNDDFARGHANHHIGTASRIE